MRLIPSSRAHSTSTAARHLVLTPAAEGEVMRENTIDEAVCTPCRNARHEECTHRSCACAVEFRWRAIRTDVNDFEVAEHPHPGARRLQAA